MQSRQLPPDVAAIEGILLVCGLDRPEYVHHPVLSPIRTCVSYIVRTRAEDFNQMLDDARIESVAGLARLGRGMLHMNREGGMNWGRALALLALGCTAIRRLSPNRHLTAFAMGMFPLYMYQAIGPQWFRAHGGWSGFKIYCERYTQEQETLRLLLVFAAVGLVAAVSACWVAYRRGSW
ncbi:ORF16 [Retroperitoneal fibromatosis-associated herpesvirus]|uniref:ORF16 n=1 Tax=Retroperitoneal fibromatosis-associated herpesvirus TaxID=111469 RepID=U5NM37_9GAMA|nr:ORF16 [Retroperitoneal fibromatosis-associated herpesvirus]AGY30698.1 ORF16 [Retroperitoneal fibromatosis-associated herpesvirus]